MSQEKSNAFQDVTYLRLQKFVGLLAAFEEVYTEGLIDKATYLGKVRTALEELEKDVEHYEDVYLSGQEAPSQPT